MQKFKCHKVVEAMKIARVEEPPPGGSNTILAGEGGEEVMVTPYYVTKHEPKVGGYYVRYEDGYESFSPAEAFEDGYTVLVTWGAPVKRYPVTEDMMRRFDVAFTYHAPKPDQPERYQTLREVARDFATVIAAATPPGREQSLALTKLEEVIFWANAAIARGEK